MGVRRRKPVSIAFLVVWIVIWTAGMILAVYTIGGAALEGAIAPAVFLVVWLAVAGLGLYNAGRRLAEMLLGERLRADPPRRESGRHEWRDDMPGPRS
jgi:hypothetical protein